MSAKPSASAWREARTIASGPLTRPYCGRWLPTRTGSDLHGDVYRSAHRRRVHQLDGRLVDIPGREAGERLLDRDARLESRQVRTEAVVDAEAERYVPVEAAGDIEGVGVRELPLVASGRAGEQRDLRARRHHLPV